LDIEADGLFLNYGYADLDPTAKPLLLVPEEKIHRYSIGLYHHMASAVDWTARTALEVSSGRGGGAWYIMRRFRPASIVGVDLCANAVEFCNRYYRVDGLSFVNGRAERLQFPSDTFDVVINVEASLYYASMEAFVSEVVRVLKPNGHFLYADFRYVEEIEQWRLQLSHPELQMLVEEDITPNVVRSLQLDADHRRALIGRYVPRLLRKPFGSFAGTSGAGLARGVPKLGERVYHNFVFRRK
jgi:ubiquinone/menaquinone biosynthesis C-methylase UbiE